MAKQKPDADSSGQAESSTWDPAAAESLESTSAQATPTGEASPTTDALRQHYEQKLQAAEEQVLRAQAESENARRRLRRDLEDQLKFANLSLVQDLVDVVDNLSRALASAQQLAGDSPERKQIVDGVQMVQAQLNGVLEKHGCRRIVATPGTEFDPTLHSALQLQPHASIPANHVAYETRVGYRLHDRVVRPAEVIVSTGPSAAGS